MPLSQQAAVSSKNMPAMGDSEKKLHREKSGDHIQEAIPDQAAQLPPLERCFLRQVEVVKNTTKNFQGKDPILCDVTSKSTTEYNRFSPFYPWGEIPMPSYFEEDDPVLRKRRSMSVEGIWQGLKMLPKKVPPEGVDLTRFETEPKPTGFKRGGRQAVSWGVCHYGGGGSPGGDCPGLSGKQLEYIDARNKIYLPTYTWVLDNKLQEDIRTLREKIKGLQDGQRLYLIDFYTNGEVKNTKSPLSHAHLLRNYLFTGKVWPPPDESEANRKARRKTEQKAAAEDKRLEKEKSAKEKEEKKRQKRQIQEEKRRKNEKTKEVAKEKKERGRQEKEKQKEKKKKRVEEEEEDSSEKMPEKKKKKSSPTPPSRTAL
jgi:hypothetical protein